MFDFRLYFVFTSLSSSLSVFSESSDDAEFSENFSDEKWDESVRNGFLDAALIFKDDLLIDVRLIMIVNVCKIEVAERQIVGCIVIHIGSFFAGADVCYVVFGSSEENSVSP